MSFFFFFFFPRLKFCIGMGRGSPSTYANGASVNITVCYLKGCFLLCILTFDLMLEVGLWGEIQSLLLFFHFFTISARELLNLEGIPV